MAKANSALATATPRRITVGRAWLLLLATLLLSFGTPVYRGWIAWVLNLPALDLWSISTMSAVSGLFLFGWFWCLTRWWYAKEAEDARTPAEAPPERVVSVGAFFVLTFIVVATQLLFVLYNSAMLDPHRHDLAVDGAKETLRESAFNLLVANRQQRHVPKTGPLSASGLPFSSEDLEPVWMFSGPRFRLQDFFITVRGKAPDFIGTELEARAVYWTRDEFPGGSRRSVRLTITGRLEGNTQWYRIDVFEPTRPD